MVAVRRPSSAWPLGQTVAIVVVACCAILGWHLWLGQARPGAVASPAGDPGLCLALVLCWRGAAPSWCAALWAMALLLGSAFSGALPIWGALIGWPAWYLARAFWSGRGRWSFVVVTVALVSFFRCAGKLFLLSFGIAPLTFSGFTLPGSFVSELVANLAFVTLSMASSVRLRRW